LGIIEKFFLLLRQERARSTARDNVGCRMEKILYVW